MSEIKKDINIEYIDINEIKEYDRNPRIHAEEQINKIAKSIKEFGYIAPIIVDKEGVIIAGHRRYRALKKLNVQKIPIIRIDHLTEEQIKAYRIIDNRLTELSDWDISLLDEELKDINEDILDILSFEEEIKDIINTEDISEQEDIKDESPYTRKIKVPIYEIKGEKPSLEELYNLDEYKKLINKIEQAKIDNKIKEFLKFAATRFIAFNYSKIAEFYAHTDKEVQELMEDLALIIIDYNKALEKGFIRLSEELAELYKDEYPEEE